MEEGKRTFFELLVGIIIFAGLCLIPGIFLKSIQTSYYCGLFVGTGLAVGMVMDMYYSLRKSLLMEADHAKSYVQKKAGFRMFLYIAVLFLTVKIPYLHILGVLLGALTLKFSAYLQPLTHKLLVKINKGR